MAALDFYDVGTISIAAGATVANITGGPLLLSNVKADDTLIVDVPGCGPVDVVDVTDDNQIVIDKWPYAAVTNADYKVRKNGLNRYSDAVIAEAVVSLTEDLDSLGYITYVSAVELAPNPRKGDEEQLAFQQASGRWWKKTGGVWADYRPPGTVLSATALGMKGDGVAANDAAHAAAVAYCVANKVTLALYDGEYLHNGPLNWAFNDLRVLALGENIVFRHTGSGIAHSFNGMANYPGSQGCVGGVFGGPGRIDLRGNAATTLIDLDNWHWGYMKVRLADAAIAFYGNDTGVVASSSVGTTFDIQILPKPGAGAFTVKPGYGINFTRPVACVFPALRVEMCGAGGLVAVKFNGAVDCLFSSGSIESNAAGGLEFDSASEDNTLTNIDAEDNGTGKDWIIRGNGFTLDQCRGNGTAAGSSIFGNHNTIRGGKFTSLTIESGAYRNHLHKAKLEGVFTDNGTDTSWFSLQGGAAVADKILYHGSISNYATPNGDASFSNKNDSAGGSARAVYEAVNGAGAAIYGIAGASYTDRPILANRGFLLAGGSTAGLVVGALGASPTIFVYNGAEVGRCTANGITSAGTLGFKSSIVPYNVALASSENLTADRTLSVRLFDANRTLSLGGDVQFNAATAIAEINAGDIWYGFANGNAQSLAGNTAASTKFLTSTGTGSGAQAPAYGVTLDTDGTLAANSDTRLASQKAVRTAINALLDANDAERFKGLIDCSSNPAYPAAESGHVYRVSVAGKIGGVAGVNVEVNDRLQCIVDGSAGGNHAAVGANWWITQGNIDGAVIGPASAVDATPAVFDGASGKLIKNVSFASFKASLAIAIADISDFVTGVAANIAPSIHGATSKATPVDADELGLVDSAAANVLKRLTWANLRATLKTYFDGLYVSTSALGTGISTFLATPTSANLAAALTDEDGSSGGLIPMETSGTWTPVDGSGFGPAFTIAIGKYVRVGNLMHLFGKVQYAASSDTHAALIGGLPAGVPNQDYAEVGHYTKNNNGFSALTVVPVKNTGNLALWNNTTATAVTNAGIAGTIFSFHVTFPMT
jgi:hypothetical protein